MAGSMNWADGPAGGTPISATNLNKLLVTADVATAGTPTGDALKAAYETRHSAIGSYNMKLDFGAKGDGTTDDSAAFAAAASAAKSALRIVPYSLQPDPAGSVVVEVPPGDYLITNPGAFLGDEAMSGKGVGFTWRGAGKTITNIIFKPAAANALATNDYWQALKFADIGFLAGTADCTFLRSYTTHSAQNYTFLNCRFSGFKYGLDLQGDNNNSEFTFIGCDSSGTQNNGAFFYVGTSSTSDQFLNYWFYAHKHWSTSAPLIDSAAGGSYHLWGVDASDWGASLSAPGYLFNLRGPSHGYGVCNFEATGVRVEAKNANAALIYSEWNQGNITFRNADWSSQAGSFTYGSIVYANYSNIDGAHMDFYDSTLAGGVTVKFAINDWQGGHALAFHNCNWLQKHSPSDVVVYDTSGAGGNTISLPPVDFNNCRSQDNNVFAAAGAAVWDARIGYRGQLLQTLRPRVVSLRAVYGTPASTDVVKFTLPVGAIITGFEALSPSGAVTEADGGTWTLATTDASPVTVAAATVSGAMSAGFDVNTAISPPFYCGSATKATLTITPTNVAQYNTQALVLVKGYW